MGDVQCDILSGDNMCCIFVRFVDTTDQKITSFRSLNNRRERDPDIYQKVTHVLFYRGTLPTFPNELSVFFPNLRFIEIYDCGMKSICAQDLKGFTKLEKLKLDFNKISYLPANLFEFTPKISQISFVHNKITRIGEDIFDNLKSLIKVDLTRNPNINFKYCVGRQDFYIMKSIIKEHCKPVESLRTMTMDLVSRNVNEQNVEEISMLAKHLGLDILYRSARLYLELD